MATGAEACKVNVCLDFSPGFHPDLWSNLLKNTHMHADMASYLCDLLLGAASYTLTHRKSNRILSQTVPSS